MGKAQWGVRRFSNWAMLIGLSAVLFVALVYPVRDGNFEFVVHRVGEPTAQPDTFEEPLGIWVLVELSITNIKNDPQTFFASNQRLLVNDAEYEAAFALDAMVDLNPGLTFTRLSCLTFHCRF